jgi:hypothetical protein
MACSPADPIILDRITSLSIVSDNDFDGVVAGNDLGMHFGWGNYPGWDLNELSNSEDITEKAWFYLSLRTPPTEMGIHKFTISIALEDERTFVLETNNITITP